MTRTAIIVISVAVTLSAMADSTSARPAIVKKGTIACDLVEAHYFVWKGRLLRQEWARAHYKADRVFPETHIQIRDAQTGERVAALAKGHEFGTIFVEGDTAYVVATGDVSIKGKRRKQINVFASKNLGTWEKWNAVDDNRFNICNTSLVKAGSEYVLMFEISRPNVTSWTARFAKSKDLKTWEVMPEEYIHGRKYMAAPHCLKYSDGYFYNFHVRNRFGYSVWVSRSRDLKAWEDSPLNPVLRADENDRKLSPRISFTDEEKKRIATAQDKNNSDIDVFGYKGKTLISYSWGNQRGTEHLAEAGYDGPVDEFLSGWFPAPPASALAPEPLADQWELVGEAVNEPGYDVWGSSPIKDDQGRIHLFSARWPGNIPFDKAWRRNSEIAHYIGDRPEGPFRFVGVMGKGAGQGWNAVGYHNPNIRKVGDTYALVFISNDGGPRHGPNQRIGMMTAPSLNGPWKLVPDASKPLLSPPDDANIWCQGSRCGVNNPSFLPHPNGKFYLYFKAASNRRKGVSMGVAIADKLEGPYVIRRDPITANDRTIEDGYAFVWRNHICLMTTDNHGMLERGGGLIWVSKNGINFQEKPLPGYHHLGRFYLKDNRPKNIKHHYTSYTKLERPQLLLDENGEPAYLYCPSGSALDGSDGTNAYVLRRKPK